FVAWPCVLPGRSQGRWIVVTSNKFAIPPEVCSFDQDRSNPAKRVKNNVVIVGRREPRQRGGNGWAQRTFAMSNLVLAMTHSFVAEADGQNELALDHRRPKLDLGGILVEPPGMVRSLLDSAFDCAFQVDAAKPVIARQSCDNAEAQAPAGAGAGLEAGTNFERRVGKRGVSGGSSSTIQNW